MVKRIMRAFRLDEISAVDRPAQAHAKMVIMKRAEPYVQTTDPDVLWFIKEGLAIDEAIEANDYVKRDFSAKQRHSAAASGAALPDGSFPIEDSGDLKNAMRAIGRAKDPEKAKAHIKARAKALGLSSELSDAFKGEPMKSSSLLKIAEWFKAMPAELDLEKAVTTGDVVDPVEPTDKGDKMTPAVKKALGLPETATEADVLNAITKQATDLDLAKANFSADEKVHHDGLASDEAKAAFIALSKDARAAVLKKAAPVVDLPDDIKKQLAEAEDTKKRLSVLEDEREQVIFAKKAVSIGIPEAKGSILRKAVAGDKAALEDVFKMLADANAGLEASHAFDEFGSSLAKTGDIHSQLLAKADELRKHDPKLTVEQAYAKAYVDPANADLAKQERREHRPT